jgi:hypothetical protein
MAISNDTWLGRWRRDRTSSTMVRFSARPQVGLRKAYGPTAKRVCRMARRRGAGFARFEQLFLHGA